MQVVPAKKSDKRDISGVLWARSKVTGLEALPSRSGAHEIRGEKAGDSIKDGEDGAKPESQDQLSVTVQASAPPSPVHTSGRGCACKLSDAESDGHAGFALLVVATIALARRRRHF